MRFSTLATALTSATLASSRLTGIAAPSTLAPNSTFTLTLLSEGYINAVADVAVAWGFDIAPGYPGSLGGFTGSAYLGPEKSNQGQDNVTITATVPEGLAGELYAGMEVLLNAGIYSLYGASGGLTVTGFNVTVKIGEATGGEIVQSEGQAWIQNSVQ
ncbi:hypothetical protein G6011_03060 [Alternaria panax]|uniref:Uncharacterized protein n=1 Tax=Alternaria panax TaxID=48097 RepID=A0AAD4IEB0_9PLEO|nr:hypothetical protein G6011_03060 [Alternaria panax]